MILPGLCIADWPVASTAHPTVHRSFERQNVHSQQHHLVLPDFAFMSITSCGRCEGAFSCSSASCMPAGHRAQEVKPPVCSTPATINNKHRVLSYMCEFIGSVIQYQLIG
jgi:hypothetical protein